MQATMMMLLQQLVLLSLCPYLVIARDASLLSVGTSMGKVPTVAEMDNSEPTRAKLTQDASLLAQSEYSTDNHAQSADVPIDSESAKNLTKLVCGQESSIKAATLLKPLDGSNIEHAQRCALVSNSGVLLQHSYGDEIDAADVVIRFNDAEVGGSVRDNVGTRDDVRVLNRMLGDSVSDAAFNFTDGTKYLLIRHREAELQPWLAKAAAHQGQVLVGTGKAEEIAAEILHSSPFDIATRMLPGGSGDYGNPTTGFLGLLLAMSMCDEVHAYGFAQTKAARHSPFHYYGSLKEVSGSQQFIHVGNHPLESVEKQVFARFDNTHVAKSDKFVIPGYGQLSFC
mmetsp:Transcript_53914/g.125980  ORF Transcript_53914/g.125980 Transcript_53914/m.125980 type:complete len:340 (+) Transcript_53914:49-1068(+)